MVQLGLGHFLLTFFFRVGKTTAGVSLSI